MRLCLGLATFGVPVISVLLLGPSLAWAAAAIVMARLVACLIQLAFADRKLPAGWTKVSVQPRLLQPLLSQGIWMTASNLIGPFVQTLDRFIIAGLVTEAVVVYYTFTSTIIQPICRSTR